MVSRFPAWDVFERKEVLPLLAQRIAQLPLASKKLLAMYYYDNLPNIRDCGLLQSACMPDLRDPHTNCRCAREGPIELYQPECHLMGGTVVDSLEKPFL